MTIVQNFLTIPITIDPIDSRIGLIHDQLKNKKINAIYLLGSSLAGQIKNPYQDSYLSTLGAIGTEDLYLNLIDYKGEHFVKNMSFNYGTFTLIPGSQLNKYDINRVIDVYQSYLSYAITNTEEIRNLLLLVIYQTEAFLPIDDQVNGSLTIKVTPTSTYQDIKLRDYVGEKLNGKKIKKIIVQNNSNNSFSIRSYLDFYTKNGKRIENIPAFLFDINGQKEIFFDYLDIDWERSFFKQRGEWRYITDEYNPETEQFETIYTYYPEITFIY